VSDYLLKREPTAPPWQLFPRRRKQQLATSPSTIICRTGEAGSLALVSSPADASEGTGRTLTGTAAVFNRWTEINSAVEGHYLERVSPRAFTKTLNEGRGTALPLLLDHGLHPALGSFLLGELRSVTADASGLRYTAELHRGLPELLVEGLAAGQYGSSFRARAIKSSVNPHPPASPHNPDRLTEVTRTELMLLDVGPTSLPAYKSTSARLRNAAPGPRLESVSDKRPSWWIEPGRPRWWIEREGALSLA
jgi:phage head maturation protease